MIIFGTMNQSTATVAFTCIAKCNECGTKHTPALHEACLELITDVKDSNHEDSDLDNVNPPDDQSEGISECTTRVGQSGTSSSNVVSALSQGTAAAVRQGRTAVVQGLQAKRRWSWL
jgi:hypothetical protein